MKKRYFILCLTLLMLSIKIDAFAQIIAWDFFTNTSTAASFASTYNDPNIQTSTLTRGSGASSTTSGYSYGMAVSFTGAANSYATAKANGSYLEFKVLSTTHYTSLSDLDVKLRIYMSSGGVNGTAANKYRWAYRKKGQTEYTGLGNAENTILPSNTPGYDDSGITQPTLDLAQVSDLQNITPGDTVTFRFYAWGGSGATSNATTAIGKSATGRGATSLMVRGTTNAKPMPILASNLSEKIAAFVLPLRAYELDEVDASTIINNLSAAKLTRGSGLVKGEALNYGFISTSPVTNTLTEAEANNIYYSIDLVSKAGQYTSLSKVLYRYRRFASGPVYYQWKYVIAGGTPIGIGTPDSFTSTLSEGVDMQVDLTEVAALKNIAPGTNVSLRLYIWGNSSTGSATGFGRFAHAGTTFHSIYICGSATQNPLLAVTAQKEGTGIKLSWQTENETNGTSFEVYHSGNGKPDQLLGTVTGQGATGSNNPYNFTDNAPIVGINYYQIRQLNAGNTEESLIVSLDTSVPQVVFFEPWDKIKWAAYYDVDGKITQPFPITSDVVFAPRTTVWQPEFNSSFTGNGLFLVNKQGIKVNGNGVVIDVTTSAQSKPLQNMYGAWALPESINGIYYSLPNQSWVTDSTLIKNFTLRGFDRGIRLGNTNGPSHPLLIDSCSMSRNTFALYTNGNNATIQRCEMVENGYGAVYSGYRSYGNVFQLITFRDNLLAHDNPSYGEFIGDAFYNTKLINNTFAKSLVNNNGLVHIGISIYRNAGENNTLREDIPMGLVIENNTFEGYTIGIHVASRMGRYPSYDISKEGRDHAFYNSIKNNSFKDCMMGIKINSEGNTIDGNTFTNTTYPIVLHNVFFRLRNTTINNQASETVHLWYTKSDYTHIPNYVYLFYFHDNANGSITRAEKRIEVISTVGAPSFTANGGINANEFALNPTPPTDVLWDHRLGSPFIRRYGEFQKDLPGNEIVATWSDKISRVLNTDYYNILIFDQNGIEINSCGRSTVGWSQLAVGYFIRTSGEMEIAAVPKTAIDGKYPVYIFRRGFADPTDILYPNNTDPSIQIATDANHQLVVTFGSLPVTLTSFTGKTQGKQVRLDWVTASEQNNSHFEVWRSIDGKQFTYLSKVDGNGTKTTRSNYQFTDNNPFNGTNYYQLKQVDFNGDHQLSDAVAVNLRLSEASFKINTPAQKDLVNLFINSVQGAATVEIYDIVGRKLLSQKIKLQNGDNQLQLPLMLNKGVYSATLSVEDQAIVSTKFVKP